ncbi:hypothetical protein CEXT_444081 [Caerostris extrusa]|uniref:Uncharacterized protein n=1 Tax=Caerostris extrusa TaxID=172846 RepID=A0AAV4WZH5_CAEEX|nr:hypothetical protein CEXT_444081 [Caerostris extrusa]
MVLKPPRNSVTGTPVAPEYHRRPFERVERRKRQATGGKKNGFHSFTEVTKSLTLHVKFNCSYDPYCLTSSHVTRQEFES